MPTKRRLFSWRLLPPLLAVLLLVKIVFFRAPGRGDFYLHQSKYQSIVQAVKASKMPLQAQEYWEVKRWSNPVALQKSQSTQIAPTLQGQVTATRTPTGYIISIVTSDEGHSGTYGYIFSDAPLTPIQGDSYRNTDAPGNLCFLGYPVNRNWWTAYNNLQ